MSPGYVGRRWIVAVAMMLAGFQSAYANDDALLQLIEVLYENGTINDEAYDKLRGAIVGSPSDQPQTPEKTVTQEPEEDARVEFKGRKIRVESPDEQFKFALGGRLMTDIAHYEDDINALGSGGEMRRVRLSWDGALARDWEYKGAVEFAGGAELKSTYIDYTGLPRGYLRFGNFKEPVSLEELSSSKYTTFMERAMLTDLAPGRNIGFGAGLTGPGWGLSGGVFAGGEDGEEEQDEGVAYTARVFYAPWRDPGVSAHLGLSASLRELGDSGVVRFRARPESHVTGVRFVDSDLLQGVDDITRFGLEAALVVDSMSMQAEYLAAELGRSAGLPSLFFDGWYAYASWFPTGESRNYDAEDGEFGRISPRRPFGQGGPGALELGLRFSHLDLTDQGIIGGSQDNLTFGLNWYATPNVRFMANYIRVLDVDRPGSEFDGDTPSIFQIRGQADF